MQHEAAFELDPIQQSMLDFWYEARADAATPTVDALDPLKLDRRALPYLIVAECLNDAGLVRYRLIGEEMVRRWGANFRGRRSDEVFTGDYRAFLERGFALSRAERSPVYSESIFRWNAGGWIKTKRLLLPFAAEPGGVPGRIVVVQVFVQTDELRVAPEIRLIREDAKCGGVIVQVPDPR